jgi:hypothetical protein
MTNNSVNSLKDIPSADNQEGQFTNDKSIHRFLILGPAVFDLDQPLYDFAQ